MPTRKELINQARAEQRSRSILSRSNNPKPAIVGIGDRDPLTGQYQVLLPDGSTSIGEKVFNSSLPRGSQVLGIPNDAGGWLLDERDVQPIKLTLQTETYGKIKVLFSTIEGAERVFWVGGDRTKPKRLHSIPVEKFLQVAQISNAGNGNKFFAGLKYKDSDGGVPATFFTIANNQKIQVAFTPTSEFLWGIADPFYAGHGFWSQTIPNGNNIALSPSNTLYSSFSQYKGEVRYVPGGSEVYQTIPFGATAQGLRTTQGFNAMAPTVDRFGKTEYYEFEEDRLEIRDSWILGSNARGAIYFYSLEDRHSSPIVAEARFLYVDTATGVETILSGDKGWIPAFNRRVSLINMIGQQLYVMNLNSTIDGSTLLIPSSTWIKTKPATLSIDAYSLGTQTTKRSIKAKVTGIPEAAIVHSVSYHP